MTAKQQTRAREAKRWAAGLTPAERTAFLAANIPLVNDLQSKMAACRQLNKKPSQARKVFGKGCAEDERVTPAAGVADKTPHG